jgi:hypothetical protein
MKRVTDPFSAQLEEEGTTLFPAVELHEWSRWETHRHIRYTGRVYGHQKFADGDEIITGPVVWVAAGRVQTENTLYILGRRKS